MVRYRRRKCIHCRNWFLPQARNAHHQRFCARPCCRHASRRLSQSRWRRRNPDYFRGADAAERVRSWRRSHPGYWRRNSTVRRARITILYRTDMLPNGALGAFQGRLNHHALQDVFLVQPPGTRLLATHPSRPLQDFMAVRPPGGYHFGRFRGRPQRTAGRTTGCPGAGNHHRRLTRVPPRVHPAPRCWNASRSSIMLLFFSPPMARVCCGDCA